MAPRRVRQGLLKPRTAPYGIPRRFATSGPPISFTSSGGPTTTSLSVARDSPT